MQGAGALTRLWFRGQPGHGCAAEMHSGYVTGSAHLMMSHECYAWGLGIEPRSVQFQGPFQQKGLWIRGWKPGLFPFPLFILPDTEQPLFLFLLLGQNF